MTQVSVAQDGISKLLAAEQEAQKIVAAARKTKSDRLKQAKADADKEVAAYKAEREGSYKEKMASNSSSAGDTVKRLAAESDEQVQQIQQNVKSHKKAVVETLIKYVTTVKL